MFTDPLNTDTDGDDVSDGMEANGYNLTYMVPQLEGEPTQYEIRDIKSDPTDKYNLGRPDGGDIDNDGMLDYDEKHPTVTAFGAIINKMNATEIENQFNPFVQENIPPVLFENDMAIESEGHINPLEASWAHIKVRPSDVGGIEKVEVRIKGWMLDYVEIYDDDGDGWYEGKLEISYALHYLLQYTVQVKMTDNSDNVLEFELEQEGFFAGVVDFVAGIWNAIKGGLAKAWEAVKAAVSFIIDFIKSLITKALDLVVQPVVTAIENWIQGMKNAITEMSAIVDVNAVESNGLLEQGDNEENNEEGSRLAKTLLNAVFSGGFFYSLIIISLTISFLSTILNAYSMGGGTALAPLFGELIKEFLIAALVGALVVKAAAAIGGIASLAALMYSLFPEDPYWAEGFGLGIISLVAAIPGIINMYDIWKETHKIKLTDALGVAFVFGGLILTLASKDWEGNSKIFAAWISFLLSIMGATLAILIKDRNDKNPLNLFRHIEEILGGVGIAYSAANLYKVYN